MLLNSFVSALQLITFFRLNSKLNFNFAMSCKFIENVLQPIFCALVKLVFVLMRLPFFDGNVVAAVVLVCGVYKRHVIESKRNAINGINIHIISISVSSLSMELRKKTLKTVASCCCLEEK